jgi:diguanylate cyclase (GGDEF)-like protein
MPEGTDRSAAPVTISCGVASLCPRNNDQQQQLVESADRALYKAKSRGRDQVCADPEDAPLQARPFFVS